MQQKGAFNLAPLIIGLIVIGGMMLRGCDEGPFGRQRVVGLSVQEEARLGAEAFREVLAKERVLPESPIVERVREIGMRLARASEDPELRKAVKLKPMTFEWEFRVVES